MLHKKINRKKISAQHRPENNILDKNSLHTINLYGMTWEQYLEGFKIHSKYLNQIQKLQKEIKSPSH